MRNFDVFSLILISIFALFLLIGIYALKKRKDIDINTKTLNDIKQEILLKQGSEQLKKLISKNLSIPVSLL